jgi:glycosyltransferase involved in cell wall biosynthesis
MSIAAAKAYPLVSIVIPVYNGSNYLAQAIDSALAQTFPHCEVLVINDGSNDRGQTERIALGYGECVRYLTKPNGGVASALNLGLAEMRGSLFSWLSHDDLYEARKIEAQLSVIQALSRDDVIVYSDYSIFADDGRRSDVRLQETDPLGFRYRLARLSNINGCTLLIPAKVIREAGGFDDSLRTTQDYDLWFRLARAHPFVHVPKVLVASRFHTQQGIFTQSALAQRECQSLHATFARELLDEEMPVSPHKGLGRLYIELARSFWARGFYEAAEIADHRAAAHGANALSRRWARWAGFGYQRIGGWLRRRLNPGIRTRLRRCFLLLSKESSH